MRKRSELIFSVLMVPVDVAALLAAFVAAYLIRVRIQDTPVAHPIGGLAFLKLALLVMPVWVLIFAFSGLYGQSNRRGRLQELGRIFVGVSGGVMFMILLDFWSKTPIFPSRAVPIYAYGLGLVFVTVGRLIMRGLQRWLFRYGVGVRRVFLIGSGVIAQRIRPELVSPRSGYHILGVIDEAQGAGKRLPHLTVYHDLASALAGQTDGDLDGFIQADSALDSAEILDIVTYATNHHMEYQFVPNQFGLYAVSASIGTLAGVPMVSLRLTPLEGWGRIAKRGFDLLGAILAIIISSPIFLVVSVIMLITDPGPIFYRHLRLARNGRAVRILKFRSMRWKYSTGPNRPYKTSEEAFTAMGRADLAKEFPRRMKVDNDPRVTRLGRFLRNTSLDELPQLFNVLASNMSLVGPRPILHEELERYGEDAPIFLALKPGLTGLWQISGRSDISYEERVKLDIYYVEHWSLQLDTRILLKTVVSVLTGRGAV